jgi:hypothetical protein
MRATLGLAATVIAAGLLAGCSSASGTGAVGQPNGPAGDVKLVGAPVASTPLPTRTRSPIPAAGESLENKEGPKAPAGPHALGSSANSAPVIYAYKKAGKKSAARFAPVSKSVGHSATSVKYLTAYQGGKPIADLAVYGFSSARSQSPVFRGQMVAQMVRQASGAKTVVSDQVQGRPFAYGSGSLGSAGWFGDNVVVLVLGPHNKTSLATARKVAYSYILNPR